VVGWDGVGDGGGSARDGGTSGLFADLLLEEAEVSLGQLEAQLQVPKVRKVRRSVEGGREGIAPHTLSEALQLLVLALHQPLVLRELVFDNRQIGLFPVPDRDPSCPLLRLYLSFLETEKLIQLLEEVSPLRGLSALLVQLLVMDLRLCAQNVHQASLLFFDLQIDFIQILNLLELVIDRCPLNGEPVSELNEPR
jgi:hypothetical protein